MTKSPELWYHYNSDTYNDADQAKLQSLLDNVDGIAIGLVTMMSSHLGAPIWQQVASIAKGHAKRVMLTSTFCDIGNTVIAAVQSAIKTKSVSFVTVGPYMSLKEAKLLHALADKKIQYVYYPIPYDMSDEACRNSYNCERVPLLKIRAAYAITCGFSYFACPGDCIAEIHKAVGGRIKIITYGIKTPWSKDDPSRTYVMVEDLRKGYADMVIVDKAIDMPDFAMTNEDAARSIRSAIENNNLIK
jgi:orotidine-5'-phosphate decarboxylase